MAQQHMTSKLYAICQDHVIAQNAIVCNMCIRHNKTVVANSGFPLVPGAAVYGYTFADGSVVANFNGGFFAYKFQVLRHGANNGTGKNAAAFANVAVG